MTTKLRALIELLERLAESLKSGWVSRGGVGEEITLEVRGPDGELKERKEVR